ncbi:MAG: chemotaxis response regulator protein-glutamate methylesterase [Alphaproteobacteria bacterium]|nr:chemotaxis response regulator protein-glutamate methylesterase [Alphaproteobacteria bacterium]
MTDPYRAMVVDDSAVIRGLLARFLEADPDISVVASVSNGQMALDRLNRTDVEVVVLDIEMPIMDGMTALPLILKKSPGIQVIMASTLTRKNAEVSLRALSLGAADYLPKPSSTREIHSTDTFKAELTEKVKALAGAKRNGRGHAAKPASARLPAKERAAPIKFARPVVQKPISLRQQIVRRPSLIAIGSSTGGPQALFKVLGNLGGLVSQPILITQHMPATFTALLAEHIARTSNIPCTEAKDGEAIRSGHIYLAPGDYHMIAERGASGNILRLTQDEQENYCRPAVDPMLRSLASLYGPRLLVIILTGMGSDGFKGADTVVARGGSVIAQDEETSVVWGMPGAVANAGICSVVLPITEIAPYVRELVARSAA